MVKRTTFLRSLISLVWLASSTVACGEPAATATRSGAFGPTKLISLNGIVKPFQYVANRAAIEALPFDGYTLAFQTSWQPFFSNGINAPGQTQDQADLATIGATKLSNSFALVWATPPTDSFDWYNDAAWTAGEPALRAIARLARTSGMKGIFFDPEPYNDRFVWGYANQPIPAGLSQRPPFADYKAKLFAKGARLMQVVQDEAPGLTVMTTRLLTDAAPDLKASTTTAEFDAYRQADQYWGLYDSFAAGMVNGITGATTLIEGNERGYDYTTTADFTAANTEIRTSLKGLLAPADRTKFDQSVQIGHPSYPAGVTQSADARFLGYYLPDQATRNAVLTDNIRNSLQQSETYAWYYADTDATLWDLATTRPAVLAALQAGKSAAATNGPPVANQAAATAARDLFVNAQNMLGIIRTSAGSAVAGVAVSASPYGLTCTATDANGMYFCKGKKGWTGSITPSKPSLQFNPPNLTIQPLNSFRNGLDFTASLQTTPPTTVPTPPTTTATPPTTTTTPTPTPTLPSRLLDSRSIARGTHWEILLPNAPAGTTGVALNVTAVDPSSDGFLTAWPCSLPKPDTSTLNFAASAGAIPNAADLGYGDGRICLDSSTPSDAIVDLTSWWSAPSVFVAPTRAVDTRSNRGAVGPLPRNGEFTIRASPNEIVALNLTSVDSQGGFLSVQPCSFVGNVSSLNVNAAETRAAGLLVQADATGCLKVIDQAAGHVIVDVTGRWSASAGRSPARLVDTRSTGNPLSKDETRSVPVPFGRVRLHVTAVAPVTSGFLTVFPCNVGRPNVSAVNFTRGGAVSNDVTLDIPSGTNACVFTSAPTGFIVDLAAAVL